MWPWSTIALLRQDTAALASRTGELECRLDEMRDDRDYWKSKAELLLDQTLFRRGEITTQVFSSPPKPSVEKTMGSIFGPLAVTEIESGKRRAPVSGDAPVKR